MARAADSTIKEALEPDALPRQQRARRDRIILAALELLKDGEYETVQIKDVADRADVALATLYRYFTSKEHLYAAALLEWSKTADAKQRAGVDQLDTDAERLRFLLIGSVKAVGRRPQLMRAEMVLANTRDPNARALFEQFAERHVEVMTAALHDVAPDEAAAIVEATSSVLGSRLRSWARGRCSLKDVERSVNRTVDLVVPDPAAPLSAPDRTDEPTAMARPDAAAAKTPPHPDDLPRNQRERRGRIIQAALELLEDREYEEVQIRDVAERADVALATVYRYFTSKEHLYVAVLIEWSKSYDLRRGADGKGLETDADRIRYLLVRAVRSFGRRPQLFRAEMVLENSSDPNARALYDEFARRHVGVMTSALHDARPEDVDTIVETTHSVLNTQLSSWARGRRTIKEVEGSVNRVVDLVLPPPATPR